MKYACALIAVEDIGRSRAFYEGVLGQKVLHDFGENLQFEGGFSLHLKSHFAGLIGRSVAPAGNNFELYFEHEDMEGLERELSGRGVEFVHRTIEQPWRQKVIRFRDPDGYIIEAGEPMDALCRRLAREGMAPGDIAKATGLPEQFVSGAICG